MVFSYNWIQSFFKKRLPRPEKLAELLTMKAFEVEEVKKIGKDWVFDIDVLPNRAGDCLSHMGIARECVALLDFGFKIPDLRFQETKDLKAKDLVKVEVKNKEDCFRYTAKVITGVKVKSSPKWVQERLKICGLRPINNIVDIANYVMLEMGQPIHAFDFDKISGIQKPSPATAGRRWRREQSSLRLSKIKKIAVRRAKKGEKILTLDDEKYDLNENVLVIADSESPLCVAGIKGGKKAEIDSKTKNIIIEAANFNPQFTRKASQRLKLKTDASWRFENGIDPNLCEFAQKRVCSLIQEIAGGTILQGLIDFYPKKVFPKRIKLDLDYVERLLGVKIPRIEIKNILKRLSFKYNREERAHYIEVLVPTFRLDVSIPEDLIEEIGRVHGFDKIKAIFPIAALIPPKRNLDIFWEDITKTILKEAGFTEAYNYSFIGEKETKIFNYKAKEIITVENPVSVEQKYLRPSLIPNLLKNVKENFKYLDEIKICELGKIFINGRRTANNEQSEKRMLAGLIAKKEGREEEFYQLKGVIDSLLNKLGISNIWYDEPSAHLRPHPAKRGSAYDEYQPTPEDSKLSIWQSQKCAEIKVDREEIGFLGEISSKILDELKLNLKVVVFDIDFEKLSKFASEETIYQPISRYPTAVRDLAVLVPRGIKVVEVLNKINVTGASLVRDVDLFDIYEGEELPEGKKNLAFHIVYQSETRTLSSEEIDRIHQKIINALEKEPNWQVRK